MTNTKSDKPHGTCPVCGAFKVLLKDGRMGRHGSGVKHVWPPRVCEGWGEFPEETLKAQNQS